MMLLKFNNARYKKSNDLLRKLSVPTSDLVTLAKLPDGIRSLLAGIRIGLWSSVLPPPDRGVTPHC